MNVYFFSLAAIYNEMLLEEVEKIITHLESACNVRCSCALDIVIYCFSSSLQPYRELISVEEVAWMKVKYGHPHSAAAAALSDEHEPL